MVKSLTMGRFLVAASVALTAAACSGGNPANSDLQSKGGGTLTVQSDQFKEGQPIPVKNSANGGDISPSISWSAPPAGTKSLALIVDDSDAKGFVHWIVFNIPPDTNSLPAGLPQTDWLNQLKGKVLQGKNGQDSTGYFGPRPPAGMPHHYHFHVYALDSTLDLNGGASRADVEKAMSNHVLAQGELTGTFESK
ncbi:MAG TPA: YbhB/YbcL family Raf kinase inhibitor-like protein [Fimbriimonadaceae bacterium]|nr:YbhB/YbcL family Raf kinase inhibitor-like protein [Fimbriimonadaceae bacterium]